MRIGILTFHRAHSYGAVLQCYALQQTLAQMEHEVWVIDYRQPYIENLYYKVFNWKCFFSMVVHLHFRYIRDTILRAIYYHRYRKKYLHTTKKCDKDTIPPFDCYVIGSDQLWSLHCTKETDKVYWGQFIRPFHSRVVGYAISSTQDSLYQMGETLIRHCLEAFSSLSFREEIIGKLIYDMVGVKGETVLDPTLLLPFDYWNGFGSVEEKRMSVVVYLMRFRNSEEINRDILRKAHQLAQLLKYEVTDLSANIVSPETFLSYFKSARYVITNSFHGVALALIFEKPLYAIRSYDSLDERYVNLLSLVNGKQMLADKDFYYPDNVRQSHQTEHKEYTCFLMFLYFNTCSSFLLAKGVYRPHWYRSTGAKHCSDQSSKFIKSDRVRNRKCSFLFSLYPISSIRL